MKPRFEEHEGKLFSMLDEPVQLKEKNTNVLVQFITHGAIGEYVMDHWLDCNQENVPIFVDSVDSDGDVTVCIENGNEHHCCPFPMFEIIGTLVKEGSHWWALYQMMQGETVTFFAQPNRTIKLVNGYIQDSISDGFWNRKSGNEFLSYASSTGWQIYKEPEQPKYKVGDWVEYRLDGDTYYGKICNIRGYVYYLSVTTEEIPKDNARALILESIIRKLSPSEVIVRIGCLSGTIRCCLSFDNDGAKHDAIKIFNSNDKSIAIIHLEVLDAPTRKFVESLLKAMREEEK